MHGVIGWGLWRVVPDGWAGRGDGGRAVGRRADKGKLVIMNYVNLFIECVSVHDNVNYVNLFIESFENCGGHASEHGSEHVTHDFLKIMALRRCFAWEFWRNYICHVITDQSEHLVLAQLHLTAWRQISNIT